MGAIQQTFAELPEVATSNDDEAWEWELARARVRGADADAGVDADVDDEWGWELARARVRDDAPPRPPRVHAVIEVERTIVVPPHARTVIAVPSLPRASSTCRVRTSSPDITRSRLPPPVPRRFPRATNQGLQMRTPAAALKLPSLLKR